MFGDLSVWSMACTFKFWMVWSGKLKCLLICSRLVEYAAAVVINSGIELL